MALTATFAADFSKFNSAVENATVRLQTFERGTKNAGKSLSAMAEGFSGQRLVREATLTANAVEKIGGVAKLTEAEIKRVAATTEAAIAKMKLMGVEPPEALKRVAANASQAAAALEKLPQTEGGIKKLSSTLGALGISLPIATVGAFATAVIGAGKAALDSAGHLVDLSQKTGLSTKAIQEMQAVADQTGTTLDAFTDSTFKLGVNLAKGTDDARASVKALGLSYEELKASSPEDQFRRVVSALEAVDNQQERNRLGVSLFGKQFSEIAAAVEDGYTEMADAASISSDAQIQALDRAGDAWARFATRSASTTRAAFGTIVLYVEDTIAAVTLDIDKFSADQQKRIRDILGEGGEGLAAYLRAIEKARTSDINLTPRVDTAGFVESLAAAQRELAKLDDAQRKQIEAGLKMHESEENIATALHVSEAAVKLYADGLREAASGAKTAESAQAAWNNSLAEYATKQEEAKKKLAEWVRDTNLALAKRSATGEDLTKALEAKTKPIFDAIIKATQVETDAQRELVKLVQDSEIQKLEAKVNAAKRGNATQREVFSLETELAQRSLSNAVANAEREFRAKALALDRTTEVGKRAYAALEAAHKQAVENMVGKFEEGQEKQKDAMKSFAESLLDIDFAGTLARAFEGGGDLWGAIKSLGSQVGSLLGESVGTLFGGKIGGKIGKQIGALLGPLMEGVKRLFSGRPVHEDIARRVAAWAGPISEGLAKAIAESASQFGGSRQAAELFNLDKILGETGGLSDSNIGKMTGKLRDIFVMVETGQFTVEQATDAMNRSFGAFADYWEEKGGLVSDQMREIIELSRRMGIESDEVSDFIDGQVKSAGSGLGRFLSIGADAQKKLGDNQKRLAELQAEYAKAGVDDQKRIAAEIKKVTDEMRGQESIARALGVTTERSALAAGAAIAAMVAELQRNGATLPEALREMQPAIDNLQAQLERVGLTGGPAFDELARLSRIAGDAVSGPILDGVAGIGEALTGLSNSALLTEDVFAGLAGQVTQAFDELVASGVDGNDALRLMQPTLQRLWELQRRFGYEVDESTQRLIDQAAEAGLVGEDMLDPQERMLELQERMVEALEGIAEHFGVVLSAGEEAARGIGRAIDTEIPDEIRIPVEFDVREAPDLDFPRGGPRTQGDEGFASGTLGRLGKWFGDFGQGTPTTLHGDEAVVTKDQAPQFARDILAASGGGGGGSVMVLPVIMGSGNVDETVEAALRAWPRAMAGNRHQIRAALMGVFGGR
jgi:predicted transcriptional regulator